MTNCLKTPVLLFLVLASGNKRRDDARYFTKHSFGGKLGLPTARMSVVSTFVMRHAVRSSHGANQIDAGNLYIIRTWVSKMTAYITLWNYYM